MVDFDVGDMLRNPFALLAEDVEASMGSIYRMTGSLGRTRYKVSHVYHVIRKKMKAEAKRLCASLSAQIGSSCLHTLVLGIPCCDKEPYLGPVPISWLLMFLQLGELDALFCNRAVSMYLVSLLRMFASSSLHSRHPHMRKLLSDVQTQLDLYSLAVAQFEHLFTFFCGAAPVEHRAAKSINHRAKRAAPPPQTKFFGPK